MTMKTCGLILAVICCLLVGIGSAGFVNDPTNQPADYRDIFGGGWFSGYETPNYTDMFGGGWFSGYEPINFIDKFNTKPLPDKNDTPSFEPVPMTMPQPLPISKEDLLKNKTITSPQKGSLISSLSPGSGGKFSFF